MVVMTITVGEVDEAPVFIDGQDVPLPCKEKTTANTATDRVHLFAAYDPEGDDMLTYTLSGADAGKFTINANIIGALTFDPQSLAGL